MHPPDYGGGVMHLVIAPPTTIVSEEPVYTVTTDYPSASTSTIYELTLRQFVTEAVASTVPLTAGRWILFSWLDTSGNSEQRKIGVRAPGIADTWSQVVRSDSGTSGALTSSAIFTLPADADVKVIARRDTFTGTLVRVGDVFGFAPLP